MNDRERFWLKFFGIGNLLIGLFLLVYYFLPFLLAVIVGWVTDGEFYGTLHWVCLYILGRLAFALIFIFSFLLLRSGILLLKKKTDCRELVTLANSVIISGFLILVIADIIYVSPIRSFDFWKASVFLFCLALFIIYSIAQIIYLSRQKIRNLFENKEVKAHLILIIFIVLISFVSPLFVQFLIRQIAQR